MSIPASPAVVATYTIAQVPPPPLPTTGPTTQAAAGRPGWADLLTSPIIPIALVMVLFIVMSGRTRKKQEQQKQSMLDAMKRGDRVQTIGGILGNVVEVHKDWVLVKVDESNNTKVRFARSAIHRVLGEEAEAK